MFVIPDALDQYSVAGLKDLATIAAGERKTLLAAVVNPEDITEEDLTRAEELQAFETKVAAEITAREAKVSRFSALNEAPVEPAAETVATPEPVVEPVVEVAVPAGTSVVAASHTRGEVLEGEVVTRPSVADLAQVSPSEPIPVRNTDFYTIIAASDVPNIPTGTELGWDRLGEAFNQRARSYPTPNGDTMVAGPMVLGDNAQFHNFALLRREFPETQQLLDGDNELVLHTKLNKVAKDATGNAQAANELTAAVGWCAPSETIYSICNPVTAEGLLDLPEVVARRGGIRHNRGIDWVTFFGGTYPALDTNVTGLQILTEAQVIAGTPTKTCLAIDCPTFVDERLNVSALCLTAGLLQRRGYPEYVTEFTQGAIAAFAHFVNREVIDVVEDGSTAVALNGSEPWDSDGTVLSNVMSAVEFAAVDMRYRLRLSRTAPIEFVFPEWLRSQMRADYIRRNAAASDDLTDAMIAAMFAVRGARVQYVMDWQDAFSGVAGGLGATTAPTTLVNTTVRFLAFPPGTWILARQDVIRLDSVYDAANLANNLVTHLFMEDGWLPMRMCPLSRVYTLPICPSGATGAQRSVDCVTP